MRRMIPECSLVHITKQTITKANMSSEKPTGFGQNLLNSLASLKSRSHNKTTTDNSNKNSNNNSNNNDQILRQNSAKFDKMLEDLTDFRGEIIFPEHREYHRIRRVWNRQIDKKPLMILQCKGVADVIDAMKAIGKLEEKPEIAIRGGGHSIQGNGMSDGGIVIDLSLMTAVRVDPERKVAFVEGGALWRDVDRETQAFGLCTVGGLISTTGVGGLTLGGGVGWLSRSYGLSCDSLLSVDLVTVNGDFVIASPTKNPDLFWALQGGGGNFGVVTGFQFQLHDVSHVTVSIAMFGVDRARDILTFYSSFSSNAPRELSAFLFLQKEHVLIVSVYNGDEEQACKLFQPLQQQHPSYFTCDRTPYYKLQRQFDEGNLPGNYCWSRSSFLPALSETIIDTIISSFQTAPNNTNVEIMHLGGAISDKQPTDTAFYFRNARYEIHAISKWTDSISSNNNSSSNNSNSSSQYREWARFFSSQMSTVSLGAGYINIDSETPGSSETSRQFSENYQRLQQVKNQYDPQNLLHVNHNIKPQLQ